MSRLSGHRKSQSTSALNVLADGGFPSALGAHRDRKRDRASQHPTLGRVIESNVPVPPLPGFTTPRSRHAHPEKPEMGVKHARSKSRSREVGVDEVKGWMNDTAKRCAERVREGYIAMLCARERIVGMRNLVIDNDKFQAFQDISLIAAHIPLLALVTRHAQALASRHPPKDAELSLVVSELSVSVGLLQGLCLLSRDCKAAVGEQHILEISIDLLLLLRTQPPPTASTGTEGHHIVYTLLELLCCVLVDSPENARTFERLSGLEAVVRVLKGTGVAKEIRMKCLEFLYFYLQPEEANSQARKVSSSSPDSSSSGDSRLYPSSPLSTSSSSIGSVGRISPSPFPTSSAHRRFEDLDLPFIPQTPQKKPQPSLGYLTPSNRRVSGASFIASTPSLEPVPASPDPVPAIRPSTSQLAAGVSERDRRQEERDAKGWSVMENARPVNAGLGLGLPKSSSMATNLSLTGAWSGTRSQRDVTAIKIETTAKPSSTYSDPFSDARTSSSGSSTVVPSRRPTGSGMSRSSTTSDLAAHSEPTGLPIRRLSMRRPTRLPQTAISEASLPPADVCASRVQRSTDDPAPRAQKTRHSRTQSLLPSLPPPPPPPVPATESMFETRRKSTPPTALSTPTTASTSMPPPSALPTPAKRAFPVELTRGIPPSASSPALNTPLGPARRVPSIKGTEAITPRKQGKGDEKGVKSYEEKKQLVSEPEGSMS